MLRIIYKPTTTAIAYGLDKKNELIVVLGGVREAS